ncbi:MAG: tetratricopeptide (TPR) repeat protein [Bacillariaceae sp.]|jgi:tetratricopeptide (TPR) repeat protein
MGAPITSSRLPPTSLQQQQQQQQQSIPGEKNGMTAQHEMDQQSLETTYTSLIQEYLQVMCLDNATFLAERMVASCRSTNAYYLLGVCHYRSRAPQRALSVLANNIHQSSSGSSGGGTKYHHSATAYLIAKCCFELQQYGRAEEALLEAARSDYKEYKSNRNQGNNGNGGTSNNNNINNNKDGNGNGNALMSMDEWLIETSPCPIPNGAAGLYLLGNICGRSNRRRRAMEYYRMSLQVRYIIYYYLI